MKCDGGSGLVAKSCLTLETRLICPWDSPGENTGVGWCREPARESPPHDKVMWERSGGQGEPELEGCPSGPA